jgi:hypothetical protein
VIGLRELQREVQAYVLGEHERVAQRVAGSAAGSARQRLEVYAHAVHMRFEEVLAEEFPGVHALLGDAAFARLARDYAAAHPSCNPSIRWFGRHLPRFLGAAAPWTEQPVLAQMACFEWARSEMIDAADSTVVRIADIAAIPPQDWAAMRPRAVPALRRVLLEYNVPAMRSALERGEPPPALRAQAPRNWLIWRKGLAIHWRSIEADEAWALDACAREASFAELCAGLCDFTGEAEAPLRAATLLKQWASDEVLQTV